MWWNVVRPYETDRMTLFKEEKKTNYQQWARDKKKTKKKQNIEGEWAVELWNRGKDSLDSSWCHQHRDSSLCCWHQEESKQSAKFWGTRPLCKRWSLGNSEETLKTTAPILGRREPRPPRLSTLYFQHCWQLHRPNWWRVNSSATKLLRYLGC